MTVLHTDIAVIGVGERQVQARQVVIATGSRPALSEAFRARTINRGAGRLRNSPPDKMGALSQRGGFSAASAPDSLNKSASCAAFLCSPTSRPAS